MAEKQEVVSRSTSTSPELSILERDSGVLRISMPLVIKVPDGRPVEQEGHSKDGGQPVQAPGLKCPQFAGDFWVARELERHKAELKKGYFSRQKPKSYHLSKAWEIWELYIAKELARQLNSLGAASNLVDVQYAVLDTDNSWTLDFGPSGKYFVCEPYATSRITVPEAGRAVLNQVISSDFPITNVVIAREAERPRPAPFPAPTRYLADPALMAQVGSRGFWVSVFEWK